MNIEDGKQILLNIQKLKWQEAFNNSQGKTQMAYICAPICIIAGAILPFAHPEQSMAALGIVTSGSALLGIHAIAPDKEINASTNENS